MAEDEEKLEEAEPVVKVEAEKPIEKKSSQGKAEIINKIFGFKADWAKLSEKDLDALYQKVTNGRELRRMAVRMLRIRAGRISKTLKSELKGAIMDAIQDSGLGDKIMEMLGGEDED